jgi:undecaprenyl-diphosphatase
VVVTGVTAVLVVALFFRRWLRAAAYVAAVRLVAIVSGFVVKELVGRPRPALPHPLIHASGWSFPSGHALGSAALFASIAVLTASAVGRAWTVAIAVVVPVVVAASRVCLGVHYVSDVGAGLVLGWAVAAVLALAPTMAPTRSG